jgi:hypothetical protein
MSKLRQLIRESITNYISEINEAGDISACESKRQKTREAIELREKKISKEGIDEAYYDIIDENKLKEFAKEIKILEKSLAKHEKMLEKLKSKANKGEKVEDTEEKEIGDEVTIDENEGMGYEGISESLTPEEEEELDMIEDEMRYAVNSDSAGNPKMKERYDYLKSKRDEMGETMNESFLHMQKLAGVITEAQYKAKKKVLNEGEYSDWWAKADDELELDFNDDIYSYVDSYDEPWQGKFANEVVNIDADNYEDFKNQVKQLYDEINPF